jgi:hypothetical protein
MTVTYTDSATHPTAISDPPLAAEWHSVAGYPTVSVKPDSFWNNQGGALGQPYPDNTPAADSPLTDGSATFASQFTGVAATGTWTLLAEDDCNAVFGAPCSTDDAVSITGWKLTLGINNTLSSTTTSLSAGTNPVKTGISDRLQRR